MRFKRRLTPVANVNLVPMIDIVFQLVIFFMVSTQLVQNPGIPIVLPGSTTSEPLIMTKLVIKVLSRDKIYYNNKEYNLNGLSDALSTISEKDKEEIKTVIIEGDKTVSYELMIEMLDVLRKHRFKGINLRTKQIE